MVLRMGMAHSVFWPENGLGFGELGKKPIPRLRGEVSSFPNYTRSLCDVKRFYCSICSLCIP